MARYKDVPDEMKVASEDIEPTFQYLIGRWFAQAQYMKEKYGADSAAYCDALENFWQGLQALQRVCSAAVDATHAQVALNNRQQDVSRMIEKELGFSPILRHRELARCSFRNLVAHDLTFDFAA